MSVYRTIGPLVLVFISAFWYIVLFGNCMDPRNLYLSSCHGDSNSNSLETGQKQKNVILSVVNVKAN